MAAGDQTWDPQLEDKMVRWTGRWAEKEIDRAAQRLGGEKQFRRKKKVEKKAAHEAGVYTHKGTAARIDGVEAPAPSAKRALPGLAPPGGHDDHDAPQIVAPEDAVCSSDRARLAAAPVAAMAPRARPAPIADAGGSRRPPPAKRRKPSAAPRRANPSLLSFAEEDEDGL